ncbi:hypothetical protein [Litorilituus lipolyticus]|uniref:Uncharacterized protein n=1 Tax=Litorilituus lipolyticus TaxID=2491017 RepID=A0A502KX50_9GAMM|nr:hypothetical protein [Litorilituus lipolyticus]TPH14531.1 hypothetical protein EPA86_11525 [Litorilituus lipolyticus]
MIGAQFKLSNKFVVILLFALVALGLFSSFDTGIRLLNFNSIIEQSRPVEVLNEQQAKDIAFLNARIELLETKLEYKSIYQDLFEKVEHRIWVIHVLLQFIFLLMIYKYLIVKRKE